MCKKYCGRTYPPWAFTPRPTHTHHFKCRWFSHSFGWGHNFISFLTQSHQLFLGVHPLSLRPHESFDPVSRKTFMFVLMHRRETTCNLTPVHVKHRNFDGDNCYDSEGGAGNLKDISAYTEVIWHSGTRWHWGEAAPGGHESYYHRSASQWEDTCSQIHNFSAGGNWTETGEMHLVQVYLLQLLEATSYITEMSRILVISGVLNCAQNSILKVYFNSFIQVQFRDIPVTLHICVLFLIYHVIVKPLDDKWFYI